MRESTIRVDVSDRFKSGTRPLLVERGNIGGQSCGRLNDRPVENLLVKFTDPRSYLLQLAGECLGIEEGVEVEGASNDTDFVCGSGDEMRAVHLRDLCAMLNAPEESVALFEFIGIFAGDVASRTQRLKGVNG